MKMGMLAGAVISITAGALAGAVASMAMENAEVRRMVYRGKKMARRCLKRL